MLASRLMDKINNADHGEAASAAISVIDKLQNYRPEEQYHALAAAFITMCEAAGLNPVEVFQRSQNLMAHADGRRRVEFRGLAAFMRNEIARHWV